MTDFIKDERFYADLRERNSRGLRDVVDPKPKPAEYPQAAVMCNACGQSHCATQCPTCKTPTPHHAVLTVKREPGEQPIFIPHFKTIGGQ